MDIMAVVFGGILAIWLLPGVIRLMGSLLKFLLENWYLVVLVLAVCNMMAPEKADEQPAMKQETEYSYEAEYSYETEYDYETEFDYETVTVTQEPLYRIDSINSGVCRNLTEDAAAVVVFVNDSDSYWSQKEMDNYMNNMVQPALDYITYNAASYGYPVSFESAYCKDFAYNGTVVDCESGYTGDLMDQFAAYMGSAGVNDRLNADREYFGEEQIAYLFVLDKPGRSYAHCHTMEGDLVEYAVLFTTMNGRTQTASVVAHETMHLFGAEDMYTENGRRVNRAAMAETLFPRELFLNHQWNVWDNQLSDYTAHTVGWVQELPETYKTAAWWS